MPTVPKQMNASQCRQAALPNQCHSLFRSLAIIGVISSCFGVSGTANAVSVDDLRVFKPYIFTSYTYDTNLFRVNETVDPMLTVGTDHLDDTYWTIGGGIDSKFNISRQILKMSATIFHNGYGDFSNIDYTGGKADIVLEWRSGERMFGKLGYDYDRALRDFSNQLVLSKDLRTRNRFLAEVGGYLNPRTSLSARASYADIQFDSGKFLGLERAVGGLKVEWKTRLENSLGFDIEYAEAKYDVTPDRNYTQYELGPILDWRLTDRSHVFGRIGYTERQHEGQSVGDFSEFTGRLNIGWKSDGGSKLNFATYREISTLGDEIATFALINGVHFTHQWQIQPNTYLALNLKYEIRDFRGDNGSILPPLSAESRRDNVGYGGIVFGLRLADALGMSFGISSELRDSNVELRDYSDRLVEIKLIAGFQPE